ncbi:MAG: glycosyltransferase [Oscillospiraceae bacterium]|nr:glycosyltransferase [Oscillospiraceae bacterium]
MKARITENKSYSADGVVLSVGMIVKNEEKHLEKCLSALKPLLDAVSGELVIVDTGSTDATVEISKRYTDKIYHFDWVNDFSAARNFGLEKCTGEWFMYLDADEILDEDISEMLDFFTDRKMLSKYNSAHYIQRNYTTPEGDDWSNFAVSRITKRTPGLRFVNPIHEIFSAILEPQRHLRTFVHHWGYAFEDAQSREQKRKRNLVPLYEELNKAPNNLRLRLHILNDIENEQKDEFFNETLKIARKKPADMWAAAIFTLNILFYFDREEHEKTLGCIDEFIKLYRGKPKNMLYLDIYMARASTLQKLERYDEAIKAVESYFRLYEAYIQNRLDPTGLGLIPITYREPEKFAAAERMYERLLFQAGRKKISFNNTMDGMRIQVVSKAAPANTAEEPVSAETEPANTAAEPVSTETEPAGASDNIILSVGMIVKNEEKYLERCLSALKPLLDGVKSELIIVDTGSTDDTVKIAERFTDKVYHFDWINDFSAARNFGLEKCTGEWFMFLDADDIFDNNLSEMINFFNNRAYNIKYNSAHYITRNYASLSDTQNFNILYNLRIARRTEALRFEGKIHESLVNADKPVMQFSAFAHHYGYAYETEEEYINKGVRNMVLLEAELEEKPDDLRIMQHYIQNSMFKTERVRATIKRALKLAENSNSLYAQPAYINAFNLYAGDGDVKKALEIIEKLIKRADKTDVILAEAYGMKGDLLFEQKKYVEAAVSINKYLSYYNEYENGNLDKSILSAIVSRYLSRDKKTALEKKLALCIGRMDVTREAEKVLSALKSGEDLSEIIKGMNYERIKEVLQDIAQNRADFPLLAAGYKDDEFFFASFTNLSFGLLLLEAAANAAGEGGQKAEINKRLTSYAARYIRSVYNPDLLNDEDIGVLPDVHRKGYYGSSTL